MRRTGAMPSFLIIGNGYPAQRVVETILQRDPACLTGLITADAEGVGATRPCAEYGVAVAGPEALSRMVSTGMPISSGNWLINANSTTVISPPILQAFSGRALNLHPGPLPEYAGLQVEQWAILNREAEFGATIHFIESTIDTGPIVAQERFPITDRDTGLSLLTRAIQCGQRLLVQIVERLLAGEALQARPQMLERRRLYRLSDALPGVIDWTKPAQWIVDFIRSRNYEPFVCPNGPAYLESGSGDRIELLRAVIGPVTSAPPGTLLKTSGRDGVIAAGDGRAVTIVKARAAFAAGSSSTIDWTALASTGGALRPKHRPS